METRADFIFLGSKIIPDWDCSHEIKMLALGRKAMTNLDSILKSKDITLLTKVHIVKAMIFPVVMYKCESWTIKKAKWQKITLSNCGVGEDNKSYLNSKEIKPVNPKGNQLGIFIGRTDAEALILWLPDAKGQLTGKDPDAGEDWVQEKWVTEDKMVGWHHQLNGLEFE